MTVDEVIGKWTEGCTAVEAKGQIIRDGNWRPLTRVLRHCKGAGIVAHKEQLNGDTVLIVSPVQAEEAPKGKTPINLPPFLLVVK